ncbi:hypothetical protein EYW49_00950 [Siculibacillus lacustris]|uniref:Uncharacterized protein n=1 Tax=Siculibacillus lacustris TaxID=1549641 RepID=A0A4Q9VYS4_9HYPH|nr:hypothetical protein EYW49_00950 [Siculibacillus lacustris]
MVDTSSRSSPTVDPRFSRRDEDVVQSIERICRDVGDPQDQGSEFISRDPDQWARQKNVVPDVSRPGKLRAEGLNAIGS